MKNPISILIFALTVLLLTALIFSVDVNASNIVGTGSFHAGGDTTVAPIGPLLFTSNFDGTCGTYGIYNEVTASCDSPISMGGTWSQITGEAGYALSAYGCGQYIEYALPDGYDGTVGTIWASVYLVTTTGGDYDYVQLFGLISPYVNCPYPQDGSDDWFGDSHVRFYVYDRDGVNFYPSGRIQNLDCSYPGGYGCDDSYNPSSAGPPKTYLAHDTWIRVGLSWKYVDDNTYLSLAVEGSGWYEDIDSAYDTVEGFQDTITYLELGEQCWYEDYAAGCDSDLRIDNLTLHNTYQEADPE